MWLWTFFRFLFLCCIMSLYVSLCVCWHLQLVRQAWRRSRSLSGSVWRVCWWPPPTWRRTPTPAWPASRGGCSCSKHTWRLFDAGTHTINVYVFVTLLKIILYNVNLHTDRIYTHLNNALFPLMSLSGLPTTCGSGRSRGRESAATWRLWVTNSLCRSGSSVSPPAFLTRWQI